MLLNQMPDSQILLTYRLATLFKVVGVVTAMIVGYITIWEFAPTFFRWWSAGASGLILLAVLAPWWRLFPEAQHPKIAHRLLVISIGLGIIGPNGAGKTSMLNVINGFYHPQEGTITFRGEERRKMKPYQAASSGISSEIYSSSSMVQMSETMILTECLCSHSLKYFIQ